MTDKAHDKELDALKADIASLREELAGLAAGLKKSADLHAEPSNAAAQPEGPIHGEEGKNILADLLHKFDASRIQGEKVFNDLAAEIKRHPLASVTAAFSLGYLIAKLWYRETKQ